MDEPSRVTPAQMDRWCRDFDSWAIGDTVCFHLFDKTPHAFRKVVEWSASREEFVKRAAFALLASVALHDKEAEDERFARCLPLVEAAAADERNFVKKGVSWALRSIARRSPGLRAAARAVARRLSTSRNPAARWVGKDALRA
jgi:3-methyladenine DNA glycosylase AlkD